MTFTFLKQAVTEADAPKLSVARVLQTNVGGFEPARGFEQIHASDLTRSEFCPREVALLDLTGDKQKEVYLPTAMRTTFDMGNAVADLFRERWVGKTAIGNWVCEKCGKTETFSRKPLPGCEKHPKCYWKYREVEFRSKTYGFTGSIDLIIDLAAPKMFLTELKIMASDEFDKLQAPLAEHRLRTCLYMFLVEDSTSPYRTELNVDRAKVVYVSRGYGRKNQEADGEILPVKEFDVVRDDASIQVYLDRAMKVKKFREDGVVPGRICATPMDKRAKMCSACKACFSEKYLPGTVHKVVHV